MLTQTSSDVFLSFIEVVYFLREGGFINNNQLSCQWGKDAAIGERGLSLSISFGSFGRRNRRFIKGVLCLFGFAETKVT